MTKHIPLLLIFAALKTDSVFAFSRYTFLLMPVDNWCLGFF